MAAPKGNCFNPKGPAKKEINWKVFEEACGIFCTQAEMEGLLGVCRDTLITRVKDHYGEDYSTVYKKFSADGKQSLRRYQMNLAKKNAAMAIWLGKQYLGQRDTQLEAQAADDMTVRYLEVIKQLADLQAFSQSREGVKAIPSNE